MTSQTTVSERVDLIRRAHRLAGGRCPRCQSTSCEVNFLLDVLGDFAAVAADALTEPDGDELGRLEAEIERLTGEVVRWKGLSRKHEDALKALRAAR